VLALALPSAVLGDLGVLAMTGPRLMENGRNEARAGSTRTPVHADNGMAGTGAVQLSCRTIVQINLRHHDCWGTQATHCGVARY
jgi:hypothetical protein